MSLARADALRLPLASESVDPPRPEVDGQLGLALEGIG